MKLERKYLILATVAGFVVAFDQLVKLYIHANYSLGESHTVIPGLFNLTYVRNIGAAFGMFRGAPEFFRLVFFMSMPPIALAIILFMLRAVENEDRWHIVALSSIFGGAIGNYIDRLRYGFVVDFLDFHVRDWSWPAFNIADSAIVGGVGLLMLILIRHDNSRAAAEKSA